MPLIQASDSTKQQTKACLFVVLKGAMTVSSCQIKKSFSFFLFAGAL